MADSAPWRLADLLWERLSEAALAAFATDRADDAARLWTAALALAESFAADDPRRACALDNLAAAQHRRGAPDEALFHRALAAWEAADAWIERMAIEPRARSSLFHLRLEQTHRARYHEIARADHRRRLHAAREATAANLARLTGDGEANCDATDAALARWSRERPPALTDERKLAGAVLLRAPAFAHDA